MAQQTIQTAYRKTKVTIRIKGRKSMQENSNPKGIVTVPPHTRVVNGKTINVGGYSYKRCH